MSKEAASTASTSILKDASVYYCDNHASCFSFMFVRY